MCRFLLYMGSPVIVGDLITEPANSLIHQSFESAERDEPLNGDGFGLAWYAPEISDDPGVFRSVSPAWSNRNLAGLARATRSHCILAHVRAASDRGTVAEANCHPFVSGPFTFMHNGDLAGYSRLRRPLLGLLSDAAYSLVEGNTDSEFLFAYFLDRFQAGQGQPVERMATALSACVHETVAHVVAAGATEPCYLNMAVSDGRHAVVTRYTSGQPKWAESLHVHTGKLYRCIEGVTRLVEPEDGAGAVIVSSERLSDDPGWRDVPANHMLVITDGRRVDQRPL